jgi:hypothetical protein
MSNCNGTAHDMAKKQANTFIDTYDHSEAAFILSREAPTSIYHNPAPGRARQQVAQGGGAKRAAGSQQYTTVHDSSYISIHTDV